jgi:hypothetical protein
MAAASAAVQALGQTSGTWIPATVTTDWNTPSQWIGSVPNGGGVANFTNENYPSSPSAEPTVSGNSYTLSQINIASVAAYRIGSGTGGGIVLPVGGGTINVTRNAVSIPFVYSNGASSLQLGSQISAPVSGGSLTVEGGGAVSLTSTANTYTGGTNVSNATLGVITDGSLGNSAGGVILNNATLAAVPGGPPSFSTSRSIAVSGTSSIYGSGESITLNGPVSGSGTLSYANAATGGLTFTASNPFSGNLVEAAEAVGVSTYGIVLQGNGAFPNVSNIYVESYFNMNNTTVSTPITRLNSAANVYLDGAYFRLATTTGQVQVETINSLTVESGYSYVGLTNSSSEEGVTTNSINQSNGASLFVRGGNVTDTPINSSTPSAGIENLISHKDPGSIGAGSIGNGGTPGTTTLSIIPWILAATGNTGAGPSYTTTTFGTWNASNGAIRPLTSSELATSLGVNSTDNVALTEAGGNDPQVPAGGATCNSLMFNGSSAVSLDSNGSDALTINSGGILAQSAAATINCPIVFPNGVTGYLQAGSNLTTLNTISGTGGVSKNFGGVWYISGQGDSSTYSGPTYLNASTTEIDTSLPYDAPSPFGMSTAPIYIMACDTYNTILEFLGSADVDRQIIVGGSAAASTDAFIYDKNGSPISFNATHGSIVLNRDLDLAFGNPAVVPGVPAANAVFNGVISGIGGLTEAGGAQSVNADSAQILNASNTYSGGTFLELGQFYAGNNAAFGTGPIYFVGAGTIGATAGPNGTDTTRTLSNNIVVNSASVTLNNAVPLTLTGSLELNGKITSIIDYGPATTIAGNIDSGGVTIKAGAVVLSGTNTFPGGVIVASNTSYPATVTFASPSALPAYTSLNVSAGATAIAAHNGGPNNNLLTSTLTNSGLVDLTNNDLVVRSGSLSTIWGQLQGGYNGGGWNGTTGIISSTAASDTTHLTTLGVMINDSGANTGTASGTALKSTVDGSPTRDGDILVKYTYYGDANLSGSVDSADYTLIDAGYLSNGSLSGWYNGDFNYDGVINGSDYTLIDNAFNTQGAAVSAEVASPTAQIAGGASSVPEPTTISLLGIGAAGLLGKRRRR